MSNAQLHKEKGNEAFKNSKYADAVGFYSAAIVANRDEPTYPLNRAAAYLKLGKYEDAEHDCTTVLTLKPKHPKALFRRGQARVGLERFGSAKQDFRAALDLAPEDKDIAKAIEEVDEKLKAKAKKAAASRTINPVAAPRRRRVPIEIVGSPASASHPPKETPLSDTGLRAVSSRALSPSSAQPSPVPQPPPSASNLEKQAAPSVSPVARVDVSPSQPSTFKEAKQTRDNVRPSRVGGGIFRPSGESKLFRTREVTPSVTLQEAPQVKTPGTFSELVKRWAAAKSPEEQWALLSKIQPSHFPSFCKSAMEPTFLASIFRTIHVVLDKGDLNTQIAIRAFLEYLPLVARFNTIFLFLSKAEKETARGIWARLGVELEGLEGAWASLLK
ncbi:TPR-like protein [Coprinellus micaceus]|uniref:RNA polymerase II-associated protein 3 n=1 Tax=Coprinellus micaceus TaxID=71717 RepID=A0A4Y7TQT8_COPMI|nr:TPR-like protein [Coprinellus micaceus]